MEPKKNMCSIGGLAKFTASIAYSVFLLVHLGFLCDIYEDECILLFINIFQLFLTRCALCVFKFETIFLQILAQVNKSITCMREGLCGFKRQGEIWIHPMFQQRKRYVIYRKIRVNNATSSAHVQLALWEVKRNRRVRHKYQLDQIKS